MERRRRAVRTFWSHRSKRGPKAKAVAQLFASDYKAMFGKTLTIVSGKAGKGDFVIQLKNNKKMGSEEYALNIAETATVTASTEQALIWGTRTILQISDKNSVAARAFATEPAKKRRFGPAERPDTRQTRIRLAWLHDGLRTQVHPYELFA